MGTGKEDELAEIDAEAAVKAGKEADIPVMIDFGYLNEVRNLPTLLLDKRVGDTYTHCYSGHREELLADGKVPPAIFAACKRCHIRRGFRRWEFLLVLRRARAHHTAGLRPRLHFDGPPHRSMNSGLKSMANAMSSVLNLGTRIEQVIAMSTWNPAPEIKRTALGNLDVGSDADVAVLRVDKGQFGFIDSAGAANSGSQLIVAELTLRKGRVVWELNGRGSQNWKNLPYGSGRSGSNSWRTSASLGACGHFCGLSVIPL